MSLVPCKECGTEISTKAKACPKCGAKVARTKWWLWIPLGLVVLIFVWGAITGPKNTVELAKMETESCIRSNGGGEWRASSGISLETFCKTKGALAGIKKACEIDPSKC
jgi:RNA polymerase subunit RPABC4/transcription elongation factor Spt4